MLQRTEETIRPISPDELLPGLIGHPDIRRSCVEHQCEGLCWSPDGEVADKEGADEGFTS